MLTEEFNNKNLVYFKSKFDTVSFKKDGKKIIIEKEKNGVASWLAFFALIALVIGLHLYSSTFRPIVSALMIGILLSSCFVIFFGYKTTIDPDSKKVIFDKNFLFIKWSNTVAFKNVLDWTLKEGEIGHQLKAKTGEAFGFLNKLKDEYLICRISKYEEALSLSTWLKNNVITPK